MFRCTECGKISFNLDKNGMCNRCVDYYIASGQRIIDKIDEDGLYAKDSSNPLETRKAKLQSAKERFEKLMQQKESKVILLYHPKIIEQIQNAFKKTENEICGAFEALKKIENAKNYTFEYKEALEQYLTRSYRYAPNEYDSHIYQTKMFDTVLQGIPKSKIEIDNSEMEIIPYFEFKSKNITKKTKLSKFCNFIVIDTETTGLNSHRDEIIEVSAIKFINFEPVEIFSTLIKPHNPISASASRVNHITDGMVENAPYFAQIEKSLRSFIGDLPIVAHNAEFDIMFLHNSGLKLNYDKTNFYDTLQLSKSLIKDAKNYKLSTLCSERYIYFENAHRAGVDTLATGLLFIELIKIRFDICNIYDLFIN